MNYPHIIAKVYGGVWAIKPDIHHAICATLEARLGGQKISMPMPDMDDVEDMEDEDGAPYKRMNGAAIVPVHGIIGQHLSSLEMMCGGCDVATVAEALEVAEEDDAVDRIILDINSPGGVVTGVPELAEQIAATNKPTFAFGDHCIASAAYWLASQADAIYVTKSMDIGSVGVYSLYLDESRAIENEGLKVNAIYAGKYKLLGASFKPMSDEDRKILQSEVDRIRDEFVGAIMASRDIPRELLEGMLFAGEQAAENNYADGTVRNLRDVLELTAR